MNPKIVPFKFTKKHSKTKQKATRSNRNYENILNDILSGKKPEKHSKAVIKTEGNEKRTLNMNKKNKIKFISKLETIYLNDESNQNLHDKNFTEENEKYNEQELKYNNNINTNNDKYINITETKESIEDKNFIDDYLMNKSKEKYNKKAKNEKSLKYKKDNYKITENELIHLLNEKNKGSTVYSKDKKCNYIKYVKTMKSDNKLKINNGEIKNNKSKDDYLSKRNYSQIKKLNDKSFTQKYNKKKENKFGTKINHLKKYDKNKRFSFRKNNNLIYNTKKVRVYNNNNTVNKITITNDENKEMNYKDYISINNDIKKKRVILNNTNSNINININITNINDKNSKKESSLSTKRKYPHMNTDNNYNSNITTVNIINNNNISKKISSNDYRLLFLNHSNKKYLPYQAKINSKLIKIESIDINLSEEDKSSNSRKRKFRFKKNLKKNNYNHNHNNILEIYEKKEVQSEYEHFLDKEDFLSNKSSTSYSCKSGFTVARKLRSLNRERDKFKMMNNLKNSEKNKIDKIEDKLINIVNKFHKDNSLNKMNKKRKSNNIWKLRKKYNNINK